jgi:nucleoredoxin
MLLGGMACMLLGLLTWMVLGATGILAQAATLAAPSDNPTAGLNLGGDAAAPDLGPLATQFAHHLISAPDGEAKTFDPAGLHGVKYWAFYYSASWCPPCRQFTPQLVQFYNDFKPKHPNFELVFVNHDQNEDAMLAYMKTDAMQWPAIRFDDIGQTGMNKFCGRGIPDLVLVDDQGSVLSDSFNGGEYLGPQHVIDDIQKMVP